MRLVEDNFPSPPLLPHSSRGYWTAAEPSWDWTPQPPPPHLFHHAPTLPPEPTPPHIFYQPLTPTTPFPLPLSPCPYPTTRTPSPSHLLPTLYPYNLLPFTSFIMSLSPQSPSP
ncbi:hypothetical protein Pcinc_039047 [Petrolisthes cinctipes]|uniref:Uncharacterized protein n=1 Tax=Petrolisthes cinctipes TaxID=88211 RepID=A0AAE1BPM0_PETCI|nr:hypothetical protein Pcinc_039047 [Petrolisthes cinctipes]